MISNKGSIRNLPMFFNTKKKINDMIALQQEMLTAPIIWINKNYGLPVIK